MPLISRIILVHTYPAELKARLLYFELHHDQSTFHFKSKQSPVSVLAKIRAAVKMTTTSSSVNLRTPSQATDDGLPSYNSAVGETPNSDATLPSPVQPIIIGSPLQADPSLPPSYARQDPKTKTYLLRPPLILARAPDVSLSPDCPRPVERPLYHLAPLRLHAISLGRLTPSATSLLALKGPYIADKLNRKVRTVTFDADTALYQCGRQHPALGGGLEAKGLKAGTVPGLVTFQPSLTGGGGKFWVRRRRERSDAEKQKAERRIARRGWKLEEEWENSVLFEVTKRRRGSGLLGTGVWVGSEGPYEWKNAEGRIVAVESVNDPGVHMLDLVEQFDGAAEGSSITVWNEAMVPQAVREVLVACWAGRLWASGKILVEP